MASLGEIFVELGVFADTKEADEFKTKLEKVAKQIKDTTKKTDKAVKKNADFTKGLKAAAKGLAGVITAITGAAMALNKLTNDLVQSNQQMLNLTRNSDIAMGTFQKWNNVGKMLGVQNAAQQIEGLNQKLFRLRLTGEGAEGFMLAGINPMGQSAEGVMEQLRNRVAGLNDTAATYLLQQMGLDPSMLHLLRMTRQEFEELGATVRKYQLTPEQSKQIQEMNKQLEIAKIKLQYLKDRAVSAIMPHWVKFMQSLARVSELLARFGKRVGEFTFKYRALVGVIALNLSRFEKVRKIFTGISAAMSGLITKIPVVGKLFVGLGSFIAKALLPLTALYLLLDDFAVYQEGGKSVIGEFIDWISGQGEDFKNIGNTFANGDINQGLQDSLIKALQILDNIVIEFGRWVKILTGLPLDKWLINLGNWLSGGAREKLQNYNYLHPNTSAISNTTNNNDNRQISMNNTIFTTQTGQSVQNDLLFAQNYAFA